MLQQLIGNFNYITKYITSTEHRIMYYAIHILYRTADISCLFLSLDNAEIYIYQLFVTQNVNGIVYHIWWMSKKLRFQNTLIVFLLSQFCLLYREANLLAEELGKVTRFRKLNHINIKLVINLNAFTMMKYF